VSIALDVADFSSIGNQRPIYMELNELLLRLQNAHLLMFCFLKRLKIDIFCIDSKVYYLRKKLTFN
jgi:hypothetical protein